MSGEFSHAWDCTAKQAVELQRTLAPRVIREDRIAEVGRVAGVDVGFENRGHTTRAAIAVLSFPALELVEQSIARQSTRFPYVPGLLSFREIPAVIAALEQLRAAPDLLLCDGQGYAHPRRFGLACHLGLIADIPSIGVAKSRLLGEHDPLPNTRGARVPLMHHGEVIGAVLRTRAHVKPVFVSIGHRVCLDSAVRYVMACAPRYRLPETTRRAHRLASGP
jgi:deoxyribonuclease V